VRSRRGPIIAAIASGVLALLLIMFLVLPKMREVSQTNDDLQNAADQELTLQAELRALQDAQAAAPETEQQIEQLDKLVPPTADLPGLFHLLQSAADRSAVDFFQFSPGAPAPDASGTFSVMASQITVTGGYFSVDEFLYNLETLERAAKVTSVTLEPLADASGETGTSVVSTSSGRLTAQLGVNFYTTDTSAGPGSLPEPAASPSLEPAGSPSSEPAGSPSSEEAA
jgi:Tfp pilus assembly protein PilO